MENESTSGKDRPSCLVTVQLQSIGEEQINSNDFDLSVKGFEKTVDVLMVWGSFSTSSSEAMISQASLDFSSSVCD